MEQRVTKVFRSHHKLAPCRVEGLHRWSLASTRFEYVHWYWYPVTHYSVHFCKGHGRRGYGCVDHSLSCCNLRRHVNRSFAERVLILTALSLFLGQATDCRGSVLSAGSTDPPVHKYFWCFDSSLRCAVPCASLEFHRRCWRSRRRRCNDVNFHFPASKNLTAIHNLRSWRELVVSAAVRVLVIVARVST